jgi:hypothetical protein
MVIPSNDLVKDIVLDIHTFLERENLIYVDRVTTVCAYRSFFLEDVLLKNLVF